MSFFNGKTETFLDLISDCEGRIMISNNRCFATTNENAAFESNSLSKRLNFAKSSHTIVQNPKLISITE